MAQAPAPRLEALGFCGADDSVNPRLLALIGRSYPLVEWGVLFRPDKEGQPRYASQEWLARLGRITQGDNGESKVGIRLAAHLCGSHVNDLLSSDADRSAAAAIDAFLVRLRGWGFRRAQVNATAVNGVRTEHLGEDTALRSLLRTAAAHPDMEFIVQKNSETEPLWSALLTNMKDGDGDGGLPENVVFLHDESKGTGKETSRWSTDGQFIATSRRTVGYAGGVKPSNVRSVAESARRACAASGGSNFWIDMESGVRTTLLRPDGTREDVFDLAKCYECIDSVCELGLMEHPSS